MKMTMQMLRAFELIIKSTMEFNPIYTGCPQKNETDFSLNSSGDKKQKIQLTYFFLQNLSIPTF